jgi:hypothetical protein
MKVNRTDLRGLLLDLPLKSLIPPALSPVGTRFVATEYCLEVYYPNGQPFLTMVELSQRAEQEAQRAEQQAQRAERLAERLRRLGVDPDTV